MSEDRITIKPLGTDNYATWATKMKALLVIKGCASAIAPPVEGQAVNAGHETKAHALLSLNVTDHHLHIFDTEKTAREVWVHFQQLYAASSTATRLELQARVTAFKKANSESMESYLARATKLWQTLQASKSKHHGV
jgi:hypothetical protein